MREIDFIFALVTKTANSTLHGVLNRHYQSEFYVWVSVHHTLIYIKKTNLMQSSSMFIGNCQIALHVSAAFCVHLQEH